MSAAPKLQTLRYELEIIKGPHAGQKFTFDKPSVTIGRENTNQIALSQDLRVSRVHAEIRNDEGQIFFVNRSQKNYVLVNGTRAEFHQLQNENVITIGETEMIIRFAPTTALVKLAPKPTSLLSSVPVSDISPMAQNFSPLPTPTKGPGKRGPIPNAMPSYQGKSNKSFRNILVALIIGLAVYFMFFDSPKKLKKNAPIRGGDIIEKELQESQEKIEVLEAKVKLQDNLAYKRAEENFIKGFRDYQKGQYMRAKEYFRIVLNLNAQHIEARKYYEQATIKHKKQIEFHFLEGLKAKEKKNYRLCKSFFSQVLVLAQGDRTGYDKYDESERYLRECSLGLEGGF